MNLKCFKHAFGKKSGRPAYLVPFSSMIHNKYFIIPSVSMPTFLHQLSGDSRKYQAIVLDWGC